MLHFHVYLKYAYCSCIRHGLEACLHILLPILGFFWRDPFFGFSFFKACSPLGLGLCLAVGFSSFSPLSCSFCSFCVSCHTALPFLLWRYLTQASWASLDLLLILPLMTQYSHLGFLVTLGILDPITFLGPFWSFS